jgi:hypothetical protein
MAASLLPPGAVMPASSTSATAVVWRCQGQLLVTVIAKASFQMVPGAAVTRIEPEGILEAEVHYGSPAGSVRFPSDRAPYRPRADVLFTGSAHAPPGTTVKSLLIRLAVFSGGLTLDKTLMVEDPGGFQTMPVVYERAFGGPGFADNPAGVGATPGSAAPSIIVRAQPQRPGSFGPIAEAWPARARLLGSLPRAALSGPVVELPADFDWSYFQAALPDQRLDFLNGEEMIVLEGLHPTLPRMRTRLPGARGMARIRGLSPFGIAEDCLLPLNADTLRIDGDEQRCTLVCRGNFAVPSEAALSGMRVLAAIEVAGSPAEWPGLPAGAARGKPGETAAPTSAATIALPSVAATIALPSPAPAIAWAPVVTSQAPRPAGRAAATLDMSSAPGKATLPFEAGRGEALPPPAPLPAQRLVTGTLGLPSAAETSRPGKRSRSHRPARDPRSSSPPRSPPWSKRRPSPRRSPRPTSLPRSPPWSRRRPPLLWRRSPRRARRPRRRRRHPPGLLPRKPRRPSPRLRLPRPRARRPRRPRSRRACTAASASPEQRARLSGAAAPRLARRRARRRLEGPRCRGRCRGLRWARRSAR